MASTTSMPIHAPAEAIWTTSTPLCVRRRAGGGVRGRCSSLLGWEAAGIGDAAVDPAAQVGVFRAAGGLDDDPALHRPAGQVERPGALLGQQSLLLIRVGPDDHAVVAHADGHIAVQQHRQPAEHALLGKARFAADQLSDAGRQALVVRHATSWHRYDAGARQRACARDAVVTAAGRITGIEPGSADPPEGWPVVEAAGATLLPGLIDTHVHLCGDSRMGALDRLPGYDDAELAGVIEQALRAQVAAGVTTVRDLGDRRWSALEWRDRSAAADGDGAVRYPTVVASGPPITSPAGHCWHMGGEVRDADELRKAVRERADRRVDVVKIMASGGATTPGTDVTACQFDLEELRLAVEEAQ